MHGSPVLIPIDTRIKQGYIREKESPFAISQTGPELSPRCIISGFSVVESWGFVGVVGTPVLRILPKLGFFLDLETALTGELLLISRGSTR